MSGNEALLRLYQKAVPSWFRSVSLVHRIPYDNPYFQSAGIDNPTPITIDVVQKVEDLRWLHVGDLTSLMTDRDAKRKRVRTFLQKVRESGERYVLVLYNFAETGESSDLAFMPDWSGSTQQVAGQKDLGRALQEAFPDYWHLRFQNLREGFGADDDAPADDVEADRSVLFVGGPNWRDQIEAFIRHADVILLMARNTTDALLYEVETIRQAAAQDRTLVIDFLSEIDLSDFSHRLRVDDEGNGLSVLPDRLPELARALQAGPPMSKAGLRTDLEPVFLDDLLRAVARETYQSEVDGALRFLNACSVEAAYLANQTMSAALVTAVIHGDRAIVARALLHKAHLLTYLSDPLIAGRYLDQAAACAEPTGALDKEVALLRGLLLLEAWPEPRPHDPVDMEVVLARCRKLRLADFDSVRDRILLARLGELLARLDGDRPRERKMRRSCAKLYRVHRGQGGPPLFGAALTFASYAATLFHMFQDKPLGTLKSPAFGASDFFLLRPNDRGDVADALRSDSLDPPECLADYPVFATLEYENLARMVRLARLAQAESRQD